MPYGILFGGMFFFCALLAAISSALNLLEVPTETVISIFKTSRKTAAIITVIIMLIISIPLSLNMNYFGNWTNFVTIYFYPLVPLIIQIAFFWVYGTKKAVADINTGSKHPISIIDTYILKYIFPGICFIVIILSIIYQGIG
jgi:neurotransmitter:Na+ symporter, NSS family